MIVKPLFGGLLFARDMRRGKMARAVHHNDAAGFVTGGLREKSPEVRLAVILSRASSRPETRGQLRCGAIVALVGCFQEPCNGLAIVLQNSVAGGISHCQRILRFPLAAFGQAL